MEQMAQIMADLQENTPKDIGGLKVLTVDNYITGETTDLSTGAKAKLTLPNSAVLFFNLENEASVCIRPSGTEPKIKAYYTVVADSKEAAQKKEKEIGVSFTKILGF